MGCDIHAIAERRSDGRWQAISDPIFTGWYEAPVADPCDWRNYDAFAILAGVRNGRGFAGIETGIGWNPIAEPRGVPDDASPAYAESVRDWDIDGHSHSWLTLTELVVSEWEAQRSTEYAVVDEAHWRDPVATGARPTMYAASVSGRSVVIVTPEQYAALNGERDPSAHYYVRTSWEWFARDAAAPLHRTCEALIAYARDHGIASDDIRLCFFFDN